MRGLLKRSGKRTVCGMVSSRNQKPPSWEKARVATALYHAEAFVCLLKSAPSRIMRVNIQSLPSGESMQKCHIAASGTTPPTDVDLQVSVTDDPGFEGKPPLIRRYGCVN